MGTIIVLCAIAAWSSLLAFADIFGPGAEGWARPVAAAFLVLHPPHEQSLGFRRWFNRAVTLRMFLPAPEGLETWPLGKKINRLQAVGLATLLPTMALFAPWWVLAGIVSFYLADCGWTHRWMKIPGLSSAFAATVAVFVAGVLARPETVSRWEQGAATASLLAGLLILAFPWIMAYRKVRRG